VPAVIPGRLRVCQDDTAQVEVAMMMHDCGTGMMVMMWIGGLLSLGLLTTLIVLLWVIIARLRRTSTWPSGEGGAGRP